MNGKIEAFDILDMNAPFDFYKWARENEPIFFDEKSGYWIVTKYTDIKYILGKETMFSAELERINFSKFLPEAIAIFSGINFEKLYGLSTTENPAHDRVKKAAFPIFNDLFNGSIKPTIKRIITEKLINIKIAQEFDIISELFYDLPAEIIFLLLGIPKSDIAKIKRWSSSRMALTWGDKEGQVAHAQNIVNYWNYTKDLIEAKLRNPQNDFPSQMLVLYKSGDLSLEDIQLVCYGLIFSGHTTTTAFLTESLKTLLQTGQWERFSLDQGGFARSFDELLRYCPSVFTRRRTALCDAKIGEKKIRKGDNLLLVIGSGNRDEEMFSEPDICDPLRSNAHKHLTFGHGMHYCLGAKLVKLEYAMTMDLLKEYYPELRLHPTNRFDYQRSISIRSLNNLRVSIDK